MKIGLGSFNDFYLEFIKLATKLEFIKEMLLQEFMYKLFLCIQDWMNSRLEYLDNIKALTM